MSLAVAISWPVNFDANGVARIGVTRVTLDTVVEAARDGLTADDIAAQYPVLQSDEIEAVLDSIRSHPDVVEEYLVERSRLREIARQENEALHDPDGVRARLASRLAPS